jgi:hypothetical protein
MLFLKNIFGTSHDFHKSADKFSKKFEPPGMNLRPPRTLKIIEN